LLIFAGGSALERLNTFQASKSGNKHLTVVCCRIGEDVSLSHVLLKNQIEVVFLDGFFVNVLHTNTSEMLLEGSCHKSCQEHENWLFNNDFAVVVLLLFVEISNLLQNLNSVL
jgi:hypothetical protein